MVRLALNLNSSCVTLMADAHSAITCQAAQRTAMPFGYQQSSVRISNQGKRWDSAVFVYGMGVACFVYSLV